MQHSFSIELAKEYGIEEAIFINNLLFWLDKNKANNKHFYEGKYWTYNSHKALTELFPYFSERQIKYLISKLVDKGLILKGNFNKDARDRTTWFTINEDNETLSKIYCFASTKLSHSSDKIVPPLPDIKPYNKKNITKVILKKENNNSFIKPNLEELKVYLNEKNITNVDPQHFIDYYESVGWKVGKNKMISWKHTINNWSRNDFKNKIQNNTYKQEEKVYL